jgi:hypothetical protein
MPAAQTIVLSAEIFAETSNAGHTDVFVDLFPADSGLRVTSHGLLFKGKGHAARAATYCNMIGNCRTHQLLAAITLLATAETKTGVNQKTTVGVSFVAAMIEVATA